MNIDILNANGGTLWEPHLAEGREGHRDNLYAVDSVHGGNGAFGLTSTVYTRLLFVSALRFLRTSVRGASKSAKCVIGLQIGLEAGFLRSWAPDNLTSTSRAVAEAKFAVARVQRTVVTILGAVVPGRSHGVRLGARGSLVYPIFTHGAFLSKSLSHPPRPQFRCDYPHDLSISIWGGKETNKDSLSSGERTGRSPALNPLAVTGCPVRKCSVKEGPSARSHRLLAQVHLERGHIEGDMPVELMACTCGPLLRVGLLESADLSGW